jgi:hypothetical protein
VGREQTYRQIQSFPDRIQNINLNDVVRQVMERIYAEQGRRGPGERFDSLNIKADERRSPLRFRGQGNRGAGALAFSGVDNASMFIAKGAYMNDNGSWVAEDNTAVIMEYNRDSATPRMFRNTNLQVGQLFQPNAVGWIALGDEEGAVAPDASAGNTVVPETSWGQVPAPGTGSKYSREDHTHGTQNYPGAADILWPHRLVTLTGPILSTDGVIIADATLGVITLTLPLAASVEGRFFHVKRVNTPPNKVTVDGNGAELIDGAATVDLIARYESLSLFSDGSEWWII